MKERPILFSGPMVEALLAGTKTKTQTRRIVAGALYGRPAVKVAPDSEIERLTSKCPYGAPGDRLWVRETLRRRGAIWTYDADGAEVTLPQGDPRIGAMLSWAHHKEGNTCVSIHMPRWASRITLEIVSVRVERLQDITEEDAEAEGVDEDPGEPQHEYHSTTGVYLGACYPDASYVRAFQALWDSINGERASWQSNPWVWVVSFQRVQP